MSIINPGDVPINENQVDGTELARRLERLYAAFHSQNSSATRPPSVTAGGMWSKTVAGGFELMLFNGSSDVTIGSVINGQYRITGDMSNATPSSRVMVQTSVANSVTAFGTMPSGTSKMAYVSAFNNSNPDSANLVSIFANADKVGIEASKTGGADLPFVINNGGQERINIAADGTVKVGSATFPAPTTTGTVMVSGAMPAFHASSTGNQNLPYAVNAIIQINSIASGFDTALAFDTGSYTYNPKVAGYYQINAVIPLRGISSGGQAVPILLKNGLTHASGPYATGSTGFDINLGVNTLIYLNGSTDFIQLAVFNGQGTGTVSANSGAYFNGVLVRAA